MLRLVLFLFFPSLLLSQHTFSIVAIDTISGEIGSAGATCLDSSMPGIDYGALAISDIILKHGAIHTQAWLSLENQKSARKRMEQGDTPNEIISWLVDNDNGEDGRKISHRQYGIVSFVDGNPASAAYTGSKNFKEASHTTGRNYSIQGNTLLNKLVLYDMEQAFLKSDGPLGDRLMAAMLAAKRHGADSRCLKLGVSSLSAFLRVAKPSDPDPTYGKLSLDINIGAVPKGVDPIDKLQKAYNDWKNNQRK